MLGKKGKRHSPRFQFQVVLEVLKGRPRCSGGRPKSVFDILTGPKTGAGSLIPILVFLLDRFQGGHSG